MKVGNKVRLRLFPESKVQKAKQYYSSKTYIISRVFKGSRNKLTSYKISIKGLVLKGTYNHTELLYVKHNQDPPGASSQIKPIRQIGLQKHAEIDALRQGQNLRPPPVRGYEFIVAKLLDVKRTGNKLLYLVKWSGYPPSEAT